MGIKDDTNIFNLGESELYDEDLEEDDEKKPKKKKNSKGVLIAVLCVSLILTAASGVLLFINLKEKNEYALTKTALVVANEKLEASEMKIKDLTNQIENLNKKIAEIPEEKVVQDEQTKNEEKVVTTSNEDISTFEAWDEFIVTSIKGLNIRENPDVDSEVIASLAKGDEFTQKGSVITAEDGSKWVEIMWDNGYGCIMSSDGTMFVKKK